MSRNDDHFDADWLSLREPIDAAARSEDLVHRLDEWLAGHTTPQLLDLGAGHGSNLRYLAPRLQGRQQWLLIDHDRDLLDHAGRQAPAGSSDGQPISIQCRNADLNELASLNLPEPDAVTASALLDLCSHDWIRTLVGRMACWRCVGLFSLNVDGQRHFIDIKGNRISNPDDEQMASWFNDHQRQTKGLGQALGPEAVNVLTAELEQAGFKIIQDSTPWHLPAGHPDTAVLARVLVDGWQSAALDMAPDQTEFIEQWTRERQDWLARGQAGLVVGHIDLLALPDSS